MSSQGPNGCGTGADDSSYGNLTWSNPGNIVGDGSDYASCSSFNISTSHYIKATNFGFSIPSSTINGIYVEIKRKSNYNYSGQNTTDNRVCIVKGGVIGSTNKADTVSYWPTSGTYKSYGANNDLWGESWSYSDVNSSDFGVVLAAYLRAGDDTNYSYVYHVRITIYYTITSSTSISKVSQVSQVSISKVLGVSNASISKVSGVSNVS